jgi:hypothetical protein
MSAMLVLLMKSSLSAKGEVTSSDMMFIPGLKVPLA